MLLASLSYGARVYFFPPSSAVPPLTAKLAKVRAPLKAITAADIANAATEAAIRPAKRACPANGTKNIAPSAVKASMNAAIVGIAARALRALFSGTLKDFPPTSTLPPNAATLAATIATENATKATDISTEAPAKRASGPAAPPPAKARAVTMPRKTKNVPTPIRAMFMSTGGKVYFPIETPSVKSFDTMTSERENATSAPLIMTEPIANFIKFGVCPPAILATIASPISKAKNAFTPSVAAAISILSWPLPQPSASPNLPRLTPSVKM